VKLTRRQWLGVASASAATVAGLAGYARFVEPRRVTVTTHRGGDRGVRIVQLTDLHLRDIGSFERRIAETVRGLSPQLVVLTGDSIDAAANVPLLDEFLGSLDARVEKIAILGNWEYWGRVDVGELGRVYARHNCELLVNGVTYRSFGGRRFRFVGLDDFVAGRPDRALISGSAEPEAATILLQHCPGFRDTVPSPSPVLCMLSGHTHGGQVAPFGWAPVRPEGSGSYVSGWYGEEGALPMYVSRGLGTSIIHARLGAPPEIAVFDF